MTIHACNCVDCFEEGACAFFSSPAVGEEQDHVICVLDVCYAFCLARVRRVVAVAPALMCD